MAELEHDLARAVDALRSKRSPPAGAKARVIAGVEARLDDPDPDDHHGHGGGPSEPGSAGGGFDGLFAAKVIGATAALTGSGLLILKLGVLAVRSLTSPPEPELATVERAELVVEAIESEAIEPEAIEPEPSEAPEVEVAAAPRPAPIRASSKRSSEPTFAKPDISAELALIEAARRAASPEATIATLKEHAQRFPDGALRDEREAMWAIASCERKDFAEAERRAHALAARRPSSPLLDRVTKACPSVAK